MFHKNLKCYRLKKNMTKKELASLVGVSPMSITYYEEDERKSGMDVIKSLAKALDVRVSDFIVNRDENLVFTHGEFRKNSKLPEKQQEYIKASVEEYLNRFYQTVDILGGEVLPDAPDSHRVELHENPEQIRSTIAHEMAHFIFIWPVDMAEKDIESMATAISGAFLFPAEDAKRELGIRRSAVTKDMTLICKEYGISMYLLVKRAALCGIINSSVEKDFYIKAGKCGWKKNEPVRIEREEPTLFLQLVLRAVSENEISVQKGAELLKQPYTFVADQYFAAEGVEVMLMAATGILGAAYAFANFAIRRDTLFHLPLAPMDVLLTQLYGMILNMFGIIVAACILYHIEFQGGAVKKMYMLPMSVSAMYFCKFLILTVLFLAAVCMQRPDGMNRGGRCAL